MTLRAPFDLPDAPPPPPLDRSPLCDGWMQELFFKTGMLDVGATFERSLASAKQYDLPHEVRLGQTMGGSQRGT